MLRLLKLVTTVCLATTFLSCLDIVIGFIDLRHFHNVGVRLFFFLVKQELLAVILHRLLCIRQNILGLLEKAKLLPLNLLVGSFCLSHFLWEYSTKDLTKNNMMDSV